MTLTELRYFVTLAHLRHFGRSAQACHVSQPTLSQALRKLEADWGVCLFERLRQDVRLTAAGERLLPQAQRVLDETERLQALIKGHDETELPLRLGCIFTVAPYLLPQLVESLRRQPPPLRLLIEENYTHLLLERLQLGELDAILIADAGDLPGLRTHVLYQEDFFALLPASHPAAGRDDLHPGEIAEEDVLLLGEGHCLRDQVLISCPSWQEAAQTSALPSGSSLQTISHMVALGMGVSVAPASALPSLLASSAALVARPLRPGGSRRIALVHRDKPGRPAALRLLLQALQSLHLAGTRSV